MQKIRKILRAVSEKTALPTNQPTNQPTNYYQQHRSYRTSLMPVQKIKRLHAIEKSTSCSDIRNKEMN